MGEYWQIYRALAGAYIRSRLQYRVSFWLRILSVALVDLAPLLLMGVVFTRFSAIRGWRWTDVALLWGISQLAYALMRCFAWQIDHFDEYIVSGDFDSFLTRPLPPLFHLLAVRFDVTELGRAATAVIVLILAGSIAGVPLTLTNIGTAAAAAVGGAMLYFSFALLVATLSFWYTRTGKLYDVLITGSLGFSEQPITIYPSAVRWILTLVLPIALVTYYPAQVLLGRNETGALLPLLALAALPVGLLFLLLSIALWHLGLRHYQSTGS